MAQMTKHALANSLKKLLRTKTINQITINDITEDCGVSRMTFYYHFHDIYELVEWIFSDAASTLLEHKDAYATWQAGFLRIFQILQENSNFIMNVYHHVSRDHLESYLHKVLFSLISVVVEQETEGMVVPEKDKRFVIDFYKYALTGIIMDWIRGNMKEDPECIVAAVSTLISDNLTQVLSRYSLDYPAPLDASYA
jgi:probable dihydroxyacetone kinase regulator